MPYPSRLLKSANSPATAVPVPPSTGSIDSDFVVILAALLCALICVLGLVAVARCAWLRRLSGARSSSAAAANRGLKKKVLRSLPKLVFSADLAPKLADADCPICLSEFAAGDEIRVLPQCGHGFHLLCIDTWLGSHSSCPSCRQILAAARCDKCGSLPPPESSSSPAAAVRERDLEAGATSASAGATTFLP